jgi:hypothetical protein
VWTHIETPYQATQATVNGGINDNQFVTPLTLKMSTQWDGVVLLAGRSGGQTIRGGTGVGENLTLMSNGSGTKGKLLFGNSTYDEVNNRLGIGTNSPGASLDVLIEGAVQSQFRSTNRALTLFAGSTNSLIDFSSEGGFKIRSKTYAERNLTTGGTILDRLTIDGTSGQVSLTPSTLTGSSATSALSISQTWNTTGSPTAIFANVTNTASGASANLMDLQVGGVSQFRVTKGGQVRALSSYIAGAGNDFSWLNRSTMYSPADGNIALSNSTYNGFNLLQFGGAASVYPAIKRVGTTTQTRLADDSNFAATQSLYQRFGSGTPEGVVTAPIGARYSRTDGGAGTSFYVKESGGSTSSGWVAK